MKKVLFAIILFAFQSAISQENTITSRKLDSLNGEPSKRGFAIIEHAPTYKGCENLSRNAGRKKCMSQKISKLFEKNFNTVIHEDSNLEIGKARILITFKINKSGNITDISAKAPDKYLEDEAIRVVKMIPQLKPGLQRGEPVIVPYTLPVLVELEPKASTFKTLKFPVFRGCDKTLSYQEQKKCTEEKIINFIKLSYDYYVADHALPLEKSTKFQLNFTINKKGKVENVKAKANHKAIAIEAIKTAKRLPKMKEPGYKNKVAIDTQMRITMTIYF